MAAPADLLHDCKVQREEELMNLKAILNEPENATNFVSVLNDDGSHSGQLRICPVLESEGTIELQIPTALVSKVRGSSPHILAVFNFVRYS
jgi:hypothetical protein